jgi:hypothetical protein
MFSKPAKASLAMSRSPMALGELANRDGSEAREANSRANGIREKAFRGVLHAGVVGIPGPPRK